MINRFSQNATHQQWMHNVLAPMGSGQTIYQWKNTFYGAKKFFETNQLLIWVNKSDEFINQHIEMIAKRSFTQSKPP